MSALGGKRTKLASLRKSLSIRDAMTGIGKAVTVSLVFLAFVATPALCVTASRPSEAPLPSGVTPSTENKVRGLYAESSYSLLSVNADVERLEEDCAARGSPARIDGRELLQNGRRRLYRSTSTIADYDERPSITTDTASCTARIALVKSVKVVPATRENLRSAGWFREHPSCSIRFRRCREGTYAGVKARCVDLGDGLVGSTSCYSIQNDFSRDLELGGSNYTDDGSGPDNSWGFDLVIPKTLIDPVVFRDDKSLPK